MDIDKNRPAIRSAEDERRDSVAGLRQQADACQSQERAIALRDAAAYLAAGFHEGAGAK